MSKAIEKNIKKTIKDTRSKMLIDDIITLYKHPSIKYNEYLSMKNMQNVGTNKIEVVDRNKIEIKVEALVLDKSTFDYIIEKAKREGK